MVKKELYPKTERASCTGDNIIITEKLDGSNLAIFKLNNEIYFAQRNNILKFEELEEQKDKLYKGLYGWANEHIEELRQELYEGSCICGEWLGMGQIKYTVDEFDKRFYMFAKGRVDENFDLTKLCYDHELFIYPFASQVVPTYIGKVPIVNIINYLPTKDSLDQIYKKYVEKVKRNVEGFVLNYKNNITKYVRMKRGKMQEHFDRLEK